MIGIGEFENPGWSANRMIGSETHDPRLWHVMRKLSPWRPTDGAENCAKEATSSEEGRTRRL